MADKKKSVAEILAAARKADASGDAATPSGNETAPSADAAEAPAAAPSAPSGDVKPATKPGGGRMSVAEMMAAARAQKEGGAPATPAAAKERPAKPAAVPAAKAAPKKEAAAAAPAEPLDTQSILSSARKSAKPGPMTKAEAQSKASPAAPDAKKAKAKEAIVVPPMPVKPAYAKPGAKPSKEEIAERRAFIFGMSSLAIGFVGLATTFALWTLGTVRFMFPNILREPPSRFSVGTPDKFPPGQVEERFKAQFGVWIVNAEYNGQQQIVALKSVCTHLGCTPNWLEAEQKFKCPCHGSGFYKDGINFEGPAPRPLERYAISIASDGSIEVDKSRTFQEEMGAWNDPTSYIPV
jgi:cytochrome b6-f complex iron-sulfur subunit